MSRQPGRGERRIGMTFAEVPQGAFYRIVGLPHRTLQKVRYGASITEDTKIFLCRSDVEVVIVKAESRTIAEAELKLEQRLRGRR
jgi:hypothetical protein